MLELILTFKIINILKTLTVDFKKFEYQKEVMEYTLPNIIHKLVLGDIDPLLDDAHGEWFTGALLGDTDAVEREKAKDWCEKILNDVGGYLRARSGSDLNFVICDGTVVTAAEILGEGVLVLSLENVS